jgi:pimeloyl-ACP methyl ester carboxylesterase
MTIAGLAGWHATALGDRFGEPVDLMGVSGGGVAALQLALDHPESVRRLVLCAAASRVGEHGLAELLRLVERERQGRSAARIGSRLLAHGPLRLLLLAAFGLPGSRPRAPGEAALVEALQAWDVTGRLGDVSAPTRAIEYAASGERAFGRRTRGRVDKVAMARS